MGLLPAARPATNSSTVSVRLRKRHQSRERFVQPILILFDVILNEDPAGWSRRVNVGLKAFFGRFMPRDLNEDLASSSLPSGFRLATS